MEEHLTGEGVIARVQRRKLARQQCRPRVTPRGCLTNCVTHANRRSARQPMHD
jgi:hypothetical protein